ncbi:tissue factor pathway inhibitor 2-like [Oncorhynchus clarkii lewisi]|uniref:tissue factor pathway inhibitor 2-like n=1 Tax=Oncorhynchus clarkii lewisi TaxID=490388 RepID=UPI0039B90367
MELSSLIFLILSCSFSYVFAFSPKQEVCLLQVDVGPCKVYLQRYHYNTFTQQCEEFIYGGCQGNANNFKSFLACQIACFGIPKVPQICTFQKEMGPCEGYFLSYFFNMTTMQSTPVLCLDPLDKGGCAASIPRYYYNSASRMCEQFIYSGCGGSSNNFISLYPDKAAWTSVLKLGNHG